MSKRLLSDYKTILSVSSILITCSKIYLINRTHNVYGYVFCCTTCNILFFRWLVVLYIRLIFGKRSKNVFDTMTNILI